jgi:hypothetical protein
MLWLERYRSECAVDRKKSTTSFSGAKGHTEEMRALLDGF